MRAAQRDGHFYKTADSTLVVRTRMKLLAKTSWYKGRTWRNLIKGDQEEEDEEQEAEHQEEQEKGGEGLALQVSRKRARPASREDEGGLAVEVRGGNSAALPDPPNPTTTTEEETQRRHLGWRLQRSSLCRGWRIPH